MQTPEKKQVLEAISNLGRRVSAADVSAKTGLSLHVATQQLNLIASETGGNLQVGTTGSIAYQFSFGFQNAYLAKGIQRTLQQVGEKAFQIGFYILRISFGIMLVLSLIIVAVLILVAVLAINKGGGGDNDRSEINFDFFDFMILRDLFFWGSYAYTPTYYDTIGYDRPSYQQQKKDNFLLTCFSFLFGDGNPNLHLEERQWQLVTQTIRDHHGVVTSELLAPYTGADPKNENGMLPVLVRYEGRPEVTDKGNIVYVFPSMQVSAAGYQSGSTVPQSLTEYPWKFSKESIDSLVPVYILAGLNFFGSWWLFANMHHILVLYSFAPLIQVLVVYGTLFMAMPAGRWGVNQWLNAGIKERNTKKQQYARLLEKPSPEVSTKLLEAKDYQIKEERISSDQLVYTTEKAALDQKDALDEKFEKIEQSKKLEA